MLYLGHPDAAYELEPEAQARLLGMIWAEEKMRAPKRKTNEMEDFARGGR